MNIWQELPKPFFILAPMEDVTDHVFRRVVAHAAQPDLFFTEFTNATGWVHAGEKAVAGRLTIHKNERYPIVAQIWGSVPSDIENLAKHCKALGYQGIDINMGCPEKTAVKSGGGAAMCLNPALAAELIEAAKRPGLPVSVKCRLGYSKVDEWHNWLKHLLKQDIAALTVHLRTKAEMSKAPAHWELMPEIKALRDKISPNTLLIGNGDDTDRIHGKELIAQTGIDGTMIGRGIFHNPFCFEEQPTAHTKQELLELLTYHLDLFEANDQQKPYQTLKRFFKIYVRDFEGAHELRNKLMETRNIADAKKLLQQ